MVADNGKKLKVDEDGPENIAPRHEFAYLLEKIGEAEEELKKIDEEASDKVLEIEQKYSEMRNPIYKKRNEIIRSIPDYWSTAFMKHHVLGGLLNEEDVKVFKYLTSLEVEDSKDVKSGYSIIFNFNLNPYFENTKLTKTFTFLGEGVTEITATPIKWKEGMGIPNGITHEKTGKKRPLADESFFSWFSSTQQDMVEDIQDEVAVIIKEYLWPSSLLYFNADPDEDSVDEDDDGDEMGESDYSEDDVEEDGDEE